MDGLECSEVMLSKVRSGNFGFRIDSHYYEKRYLRLNHKLSEMEHWTLKEIVSKPIQTGHTPSMKKEDYYGGKIAFIKTDNLHSNHIGEVFSDYLSELGNMQIARTALQENDIITTIIGATEEVIARSALILPEHLPANINQNIVQIRVNCEMALPEYVNAYLNCKYGREYFRYLSRQTEQVNLNCKEVESVIVPKFSADFQKNIRMCVIEAHDCQQTAKRLYAEAESILNSFIGTIEISSAESISIKLFSESFCASGRLDAEYYQQKYKSYADVLKTEDTVLSLCQIEDKNYVPKESEEYHYIELSHVGMSGDISGVELQKGSELPSRARRRVKKGQVIVPSVEGSMHSCGLITDEFDGAICSTGFYVLESNKINPETLLVLFKSEPIQALMKQRCSGTILTAITKDEFLAIPLPQIGIKIQKEIQEKVKESFAQRRKSEWLLECGKRAVEIAIEQGEKRAVAWLKGNKDLYGVNGKMINKSDCLQTSSDML